MAQTTSVLWSVDQGLGEKAKEQARQNIGAASEKLTEVVNNHTEKIKANTTEIGQIKVDVADIESSLLNKKDKQQLKSFNGSSKQTIKNISQTENGELNVEFEDIDMQNTYVSVNLTQDFTNEQKGTARANINATNVVADGVHIDSLTISNNLLTAGNNQYKLNKVGELSYPYVISTQLIGKKANDTSESVIAEFSEEGLKISTYTPSASAIQLMFTPTGSQQRIMFAYDRQGSTNKTMYSAIASSTGDSPIYSLNIPVGTLTIGSSIIRLTDYVLELEYMNEATADKHNLTCVAKWWRI